MVTIKTTNIYNKEITHYEHPFIQTLIRVINGGGNKVAPLSKFINTILSTAVGELIIHRDEKDELVLADKFGHTFHIYNGCAYVRTYPSPQNIPHNVLSSLARYYWKNDEWVNMEKLSKFIQMNGDERKKNGFPFYGDLWECEEEIDQYNVTFEHICNITNISFNVTNTEWLDGATFLVNFESIEDEEDGFTKELQAEYHHDEGKIVIELCYYNTDGDFCGCADDIAADLSSEQIMKIREIVIKEVAKTF